MSGSGPILLVSTYELGHQPLNLASPLALLTEAALDVSVVDTSVVALSKNSVEKAWFIAISVPMHTATRLALPLIAQIRVWNPTVHLCCYGLYAVLNSSYLFEQGVNFVIGGEYEAPLRGLIETLAVGEAALPNGVATVSRPVEPHLAKVPFAVPRRQALPPLRHYAQLEANGRRTPAGYVEASRGCLHTCLHCPITPVYGGRFFVVPQEVVLADICTQVEMGAGHITFGDPDFFNGPGHSLQILRAMHAEFPHLTFDITTKIEHILEFRRHFAELKALGCAFVVSAVESFSDRVLAQLDKGHRRADIARALEVLTGTGIPLRPSLVAFTPWTSLDDYLDMLDQIELLGLVDQIDPVQYSIRLLVPPQSALIDRPEADAWLGALRPETLTYQWRHSNPRLDTLHQTVSELVEFAAAANEDARTTFYRVRAVALAVALGREPALEPSCLPAPGQPAATPRLTEPWFC
jgi:radical SAM superfamily enzyme YgiQ (UPF0313 family)